MDKVTLEGYIIVPDSDLDRVQAELPNHIALTRRESGCLVFNVNQDQDNKNRFNVYEEFKDRESFDNHEVRAADSKWATITKNVQRFYEITGGD